jgi:hypothetical protein
MRRNNTLKWTNKENAPIVKQKYVSDAKISSDMKQLLGDTLAPGSMFFLQEDLYLRLTQKNEAEPPLPVLLTGKQHFSGRRAFMCQPHAYVGSLLMYMGPIRFEECTSTKERRILRVIRHTFIFENGQYIIPDIGALCPLKT